MPNRSHQVKIITADDHPLIRTSLKMTFQDRPEFKLVAEASNGIELLELANKLKPDIVITDIKMPLMDGIEATKQLTIQLPGTNVIALSIIEDEDLIVQMIEAGAKGYLLKDVMVREVINAVLTVHNGHTYFSKQISNHVRRMIANGTFRSRQDSRSTFSEKEISIIKLICQEYSTKEIAHELGMTKRAVDWMRDNILKKIKAKNTAGLVVFAIKQKIF